MKKETFESIFKDLSKEGAIEIVFGFVPKQESMINADNYWGLASFEYTYTKEKNIGTIRVNGTTSLFNAAFELREQIRDRKKAITLRK